MHCPIYLLNLYVKTHCCGCLCVAGSYEQSPSLSGDAVQWEGAPPVQSAVVPDERLRETLADAMLESPVKDHAGMTPGGGGGSVTKNL